MSTATNSVPLPIRAVPVARVHVMRGVAAGFDTDSLAPVVGPLFDRLADRLIASGRWPSQPGVAWYVPDGQGEFLVNVSFAAGPETTLGPVGDQDFAVIDLPAIETAAIAVHRGHPHGLGDAWQSLMEAATRDGWVQSGPAREVYQSSIMVPLEQWVTELQLPVVRGTATTTSMYTAPRST
jgi:effector-binding domain-containing protein